MYNTTQHNTTQHNTTQHNTTQHNTTQHNTTQHNTTQHNTTQHVDYLAQRLFVNDFKKSLLILKGLVDSFSVPSFLKGGVCFA
ncbi:hypothetical protein LMC10_04570 [Limosilactobacillus reuteri]|uniref:hypothetical protein n=1 Tax=Limosilactobacillus reuteri TaxID=1598 RepID=UPI001E62BB10|nr:hypothetical protein [Limosilactobacillus reuteri]MCC4399363.1 hypothetical protein [Limosilactobacillus reuteri]